MLTSQRLLRILITASLALLLESSVSAQDEVDLERLSAETSAAHQIYVFATNGGTTNVDWANAGETGTTEAIASSMAPVDQAGAAVVDQNAGAFGGGLNIARAGWSRNRITEGSFYRDLLVYSEPSHPAVRALCEESFGNVAEAHWKIPEDETGDTWIQAEIELVAPGAWADTEEDQIYSQFGIFGAVEVADTYIAYFMWPNGTIEVSGRLMDLDESHEIDETFPGPVVSFTVRQYVDPGDEFITYTSHDSYSLGANLWTEVYEGYPEQGVVGTTMARSKHLEAYVGDPPE
jgi:hypothetical protein